MKTLTQITTRAIDLLIDDLLVGETETVAIDTLRVIGSDATPAESGRDLATALQLWLVRPNDQHRLELTTTLRSARSAVTAEVSA